MECKQCGASLKEGAKFCAKCGERVEELAVEVTETSVEMTAEEKSTEEQTTEEKITEEQIIEDEITKETSIEDEVVNEVATEDENRDEQTEEIIPSNQCMYCKKELKPGAKFCPYCGQQQIGEVINQTPVAVEPTEPIVEKEAMPEEEQLAEEKPEEVKTAEVKLVEEKPVEEKPVQEDVPKKNKKKLLLGAIGVVGVVACIGIGASLLQGLGSGTDTMALGMYTNEDEEVFITNDKGKFIEVGDMTDIRQFKYSQDGKNTYISMDDALYRIDGKKVVELADDVESYAISSDGKVVIYLQENSNGDYTLIYQMKGKKAVEVCEEAGYNAYISPKGKYMVYRDQEEEQTVLYTQSGEKKTIKDMYTPLGVNDEGSVIGYSMDEDAFYLVKGDEHIELGEGNTRLFASGDLKTIYMEEEGALRCYQNGKIHKVMDKVRDVSPIKRTQKEVVLAFGKDQDTYVTLQGEAAAKLGKNVSYYTIKTAKKSNTFYFENNGKLYIKAFNNKGKETTDEKIETDMFDVAYSPDGKYYTYNKDGQIFSGSESKKPKMVSESGSECYVANNGDVRFIGSFDTLFYAKGGKNAKEVAEDVYAIAGVAGNKTYVVDEEDNFYEQQGTGKLKLIAEDVEEASIMGTTRVAEDFYNYNFSQIGY
ncbi:MAG: zinc-ribbon domain-containing protein [Cellulosilyticaceae bacterium]